MTRSAILPVMSAVAALLILNGCASRASVSSKWLDRQESAAPYSRVLVVGVSRNTTRRLSFEDAVAEDLRVEGVTAWSSTRLLPEDVKPDEVVVREVAAQRGADAIVVTRVTSIEMTPVEIGGRSTVLAEQHQTGQDHTFRRQQGTLFRYDFKEDVEATFVTAEFTTELHTDVYDAASGKLVYSIDSAIAGQESLSDVIAILGDAIARRLKRDGVVGGS